MTLNNICKTISQELGLEFETVRDIVLYEFKFTKNVMQDPNEHRDILFNKLFKFKLKTKFKSKSEVHT